MTSEKRIKDSEKATVLCLKHLDNLRQEGEAEGVDCLNLLSVNCLLNLQGFGAVSGSGGVDAESFNEILKSFARNARIEFISYRPTKNG